MVISTRLGGIVSVCAPVAASSATSSPGLGAALASSPETAPAPPPPCRRPSSPRCRRPDTSRRPAHSAARRAHGRAGWRGTRPSPRAMPVISISRPRKTNSGTASRMRWPCPRPCGRPAPVSGVWSPARDSRTWRARRRRRSARRQRPRGDDADEKDQELRLPRPVKDGAASQNSRHNAATAPSASAAARGASAASRSSAKSIISATPAGSAAARQASVICSAGVVSAIRRRVLVGRRHDDQKRKSQRRSGGEGLERGPRRPATPGDAGRHPHVLVAANAITAPSIASHRNSDRGQFVRPHQRPAETRSARPRRRTG